MRFHSREAFDANHEEIQAAVQLLVADPKRRKRFRIATVYERDSNELLAEVLEVNSGPVVAYSARVGGAMANWAPGRSIVLHDRQHRPFRMISPLTGADD